MFLRADQSKDVNSPDLNSRKLSPPASNSPVSADAQVEPSSHPLEKTENPTLRDLNTPKSDPFLIPPKKMIDPVELTTTQELLAALEHTYRTLDDFLQNAREGNLVGFNRDSNPPIDISLLLADLYRAEDLLTSLSLQGAHQIAIGDEGINLFSFIKESATALSAFLQTAESLHTNGILNEQQVESFFEGLYLLKKTLRDYQLQLSETLNTLLLNLESHYVQMLQQSGEDNLSPDLPKQVPAIVANIQAIKNHPRFEQQFFPLFEEFIATVGQLANEAKKLSVSKKKIGFRDKKTGASRRGDINLGKYRKKLKDISRKLANLERQPLGIDILTPSKQKTVSGIIMLCNELFLGLVKERPRLSENDSSFNIKQAALATIREASSIARTPKAAYEFLVAGPVADTMKTVTALIQQQNQQLQDQQKTDASSNTSDQDKKNAA